jgi:predicted RNA-binding Zn ribbon-like protein
MPHHPFRLESSVDPSRIADHPVLDFVNTLTRVNGYDVDQFEQDNDVLQWLQATSWYAGAKVPHFAEYTLLQEARNLRGTIRTLLEKRKADEQADPQELNRYLMAARSYPQLRWASKSSPVLVRHREMATPEEFLGPVTEAAAELLASASFDLVRKCEDGSCIRWFYDRTKAHRRRWCSMAVCGNRNKVRAFRERQ